MCQLVQAKSIRSGLELTASEEYSSVTRYVTEFLRDITEPFEFEQVLEDLEL